MVGPNATEILPPRMAFPRLNIDRVDLPTKYCQTPTPLPACYGLPCKVEAQHVCRVHNSYREI